jgi:hypothetical protein
MAGTSAIDDSIFQNQIETGARIDVPYQEHVVGVRSADAERA